MAVNTTSLGIGDAVHGDAGLNKMTASQTARWAKMPK
jgi:hypothetical protein